MGDSESAVTETSAVMDYTPAAATGADAAAGYSVPMGSDLGEGVTAPQPAAYNMSVNGYAGAPSVENGIAADAVDGAATATEQQFVDGSAMSGEEERLWSIVKANSLDFDSWTALIEETEKVAGDKILKIRNVYDTFLAEFPLCYGYWKKYADHEARLGAMDKVLEVYERAVLGVTYSVDIWLHYCIFSINTYGDSDTVRRLFERGLAYVGTDYLSFPLWDKYIEYEEMHAEWGRVATIYGRILEIPSKRLDDYFNRFRNFAATHFFSDLRTAEEAASTTAASSEDGNQATEGEVQPDADQSLKSASVGLTEGEELEKYIAIREEMYKKAKEFDSKISDFENAIRRPYFHVRPLNGAELENWHNYLDFIEGQDNLNKVVKLYERCLIACANYPEYWIRYVLSMETCGSMDLASNALSRATQVFVKRQAEIHLFAARFREQSGDIPGAQAAYQLLHSEIAPGLLEAIVNHANMEHRLGNHGDAFSLFEQAIAIEKGKEHSQMLSALYAQYARFLYLVSKNTEKANEVLIEAIENVQLSKSLLEALIHLESFWSLPKRIDYLDSLVEKFIIPTSESLNAACATDREELSCIFLEFLGMFGDVKSIKRAADRHAKLFLPHKSKSEVKKRHAEDSLASDKTKVVKPYSDAVSPAQSVVGAYANTQNQWPGGYGVQPQPQAWPTANQAQWNPNYSQQAGYGAAYGGYTATQVPMTVAPNAAAAAAYGSYPAATYPAQQAYPQQSYVQPAVTAAVAPVQQTAAAAPQPYYRTYY